MVKSAIGRFEPPKLQRRVRCETLLPLLIRVGMVEEFHRAEAELERAKPLLAALREHRIIVDMTHLTDQGFWEMLDAYDGPVAASHHNCRALVPGQRQLPDDMIKASIAKATYVGGHT